MTLDTLLGLHQWLPERRRWDGFAWTNTCARCGLRRAGMR